MSLKSLISTGTKVWLNGVEPGQIKSNRALGITGATSNPTIISQIIEKGTFDRRIVELMGQGLDDNAIAWTLDDELVWSAQEVFMTVWEETPGDDGYVSFELDPLMRKYSDCDVSAGLEVGASPASDCLLDLLPIDAID
jgi:transaldolase